MVNEVRLVGTVLNAYMSDTGAFICKLLFPHEHYVGNQKMDCESVFITVMTDDISIRRTDIIKGDKVLLTGYLKLDYKRTLGGNQHQIVQIYTTEIEKLPEKTRMY